MEHLLSNRWTQFFFLSALLLVLVIFSFSDTRWREQIRNFTFDNYNIAKPRESSSNVVIVDIDEASLGIIGQMPWPRSVMADLVTKLKAMGARVVVFDIVFAEHDRTSPAIFASHLQGQEGMQDIIARLDALPDNDVLFGQSIKDAGNVVTGFSFTHDETGSVPQQIGIFRGKNIERFVPALEGATVNLKSIGHGAAGNGSFFVSTDTDGIIRRVPMLIAHQRKDSKAASIYPSLSLETMRVLEGERGGKIMLANEEYARLDAKRFGIEGIEIGKAKRFIPTDARGEFLVYFAKSDPAWYIPAYKILDKSLDKSAMKDKVVFVGTSAVGLKDIRSTPLNTSIPGVEIHLNIVDQILQGKYLTRSIEAEGTEAVAILVIGVFIIALAPFVGALALAVIVSGMIAAAIFSGWYGFVHYGLLLDIAYPSLCVLAIFMLSTILTYIRTERERKHVRRSFGFYISPEFMQELTRNPEKLKLGGETRELTVMFSDIRNFTSICENLSPEEIIHLMNDFLTPMTDLVMHNRGTIDKYIGDAMMAFWNAPLDDADHVIHACTTALGMQSALIPVNKRIEEKARQQGTVYKPLRTGIGLNTGPCAVGNMGSKQRFAYSALGDAVNLSSRLEGLTKIYGVNIIAGESVWQQAQDFAFLELDVVQVKGREKPARIFALIGDVSMAQQESFKFWNENHQEMLRLYRKRDFVGAEDMLDALIRLDKNDLLSITYTVYRLRILELAKNPPPENWDGIYKALSK